MDLTPEQIEAVNVQRAAILQHNGNFLYHVFSGKEIATPLKIKSMEQVYTRLPKFVEVIDPELSVVDSTNDSFDPDGGIRPSFVKSKVTEVKPPVKKKASLKVVK